MLCSKFPRVPERFFPVQITSAEFVKFIESLLRELEHALIEGAKDVGRGEDRKKIICGDARVRDVCYKKYSFTERHVGVDIKPAITKCVRACS
jgi:hypothetical protein